ncbi:MAG: AMP-binding protein, partial [Anaerolineae bacterium]|nr:AMP-binding protein [Anaerolineae bacterium]
MVTYVDRPWLKKYDQGVPDSLKPYPNTPLHNFLMESARRAPANTALITNLHLPVLGRVDKNLTYAELDAQSDALAAMLVDKGLKKGDRVALVMPNIAAFVIGFYAVLKAGGVVAATNPTYPPEKLQYQINDCDA